MSTLPFQTKIINLKRLAEVSGLSYDTLYGMKIGRTGKRTPMSAANRTKVANALFKELQDTFGDLGFEINLSRIADPPDRG